MGNSGRRLTAFLTAMGVFAWDRWTKEIVETRFGAYDTKVVIPGFFNIVHSQNPGVAFGIFQENPSHSRTLLLVAVSIESIHLGCGLELVQRRCKRLPAFTERLGIRRNLRVCYDDRRKGDGFKPIVNVWTALGVYARWR